ncbi:MAG: hypothetical protein U5Q03_04790 [Bacteroidota bacterium]|nr:hypothetical protein [Bacteroidota bacterium]
MHKEIEFSDLEWENQNDATLYCYTHPLKNIENFSTVSNRWRIFDFNGNSYFVLTFSVHFGLLQEITGVSSDTIFTKAWVDNSFKYPTLTKVKDTSQYVINNISNFLSNKSWKVKEVIYDTSLISNKFHKSINSLIDKLAYKDNMKFNFISDRISVMSNDSCIYDANWKLTNDGKFIELSSKTNLSGFLEIINIDKSEMTLRNLPIFDRLLGVENFKSIEFEIQFE